MGPDNQIGAGTLYFRMDNKLEPMGKVTDAYIEFADDPEREQVVRRLSDGTISFELTIRRRKMTRKRLQKLLMGRGLSRNMAFYTILLARSMGRKSYFDIWIDPRFMF